MTDTQATLTAGIAGAIIGGVIGIIGTYIGAVRIANRQHLVEAGRRLRDAFQEELAILQASEDIEVCDLLKSAFKKHLIAVSEFKYILPKSKSIIFSQAWEQYHCHPELTHIQFLEQYSTIGSREQKNSNRKLAIERIKHILSFTECRKNNIWKRWFKKITMVC